MYRQYSLMLHNLECLHVGYNVTQVRCNINISYCEVTIIITELFTLDII